MREKGAQWLVTLGLVHHWARRQVSPTSLAFGESSSLPLLAADRALYCTAGAQPLLADFGHVKQMSKKCHNFFFRFFFRLQMGSSGL